IAQMKEMAQKYAAGNLNEPLMTVGATELTELARALNKMAQQLSERITTIIEDKKQIQAILSSMIEGVLAVNGSGNIVSLNSAAAKALGIDESLALGHNFEEVVRNPELQRFIQSIFDGNRPSETDINTASSGQRILQLHGTSLTDSKGEKNGAVVVLYDITRLRRLEDVRRDFVANVSHELKTPITSIKGFIETLQDGAADNPEETARFLEIIARHADRLNAIVDDLLSLSRLEEDTESRRVFFEMAYIKPIISSAIELAATKAQKKNISIEMECDENITAKVNSVLIEQAIFNFIDNAIKYSNPETKIKVTAILQEDKLDISVSDTGNGIEEQHLPRLFERFYVVDKSRSRKLGGTGLGLSIVKHIALVHCGEVTVVSQPGQGSTFSLHLPAHLAIQQ
ncbi:MAG: PAS domain-containing protein, partial [Sedimentisphaerales bacterium]|nr:PAS domain-containing protein [Sedimentisphaerales bacterium]